MAQSENKLLSAYLIVGEDALKRRVVLEKLRKRAAEEGATEFNHDEIDGEQASGGDIVAACNTLPFASDLRLVEVKHADKLGKQDCEALVSYLEAPSETTVLALQAEKLNKGSRLHKAVSALGKTSVIDCAPMKRRELVSAVRSMAVGKGFTMTQAGAETLIDLVGEDTVRIDSELSKLAMAQTDNQPVGQSTVASLVERTTETKPWQFVDAFSARDLKRCLDLLPTVNTSPYALIGMVTTRVRELICAQSLAARGQSSRLAETLKVPSWRVKNHLSWARSFSERELQTLISTARDCERAMKSGADPDLAFKDWTIASLKK